MANLTFSDLVLFAIVIVLLVMIVCRYRNKDLHYHDYAERERTLNATVAAPAPQNYTNPDNAPNKGLNDLETCPTHFYEREREGFDTRWIPDVHVPLEPKQVLHGQENSKQFGFELTSGTEWGRAVDHSNQNPSLTGVTVKAVDTSRERYN